MDGSSTIRPINIHPLKLLIKNSRFRDNRALVGADFLVTWYLDLKNKTGIDNSTIRTSPFEMTSHCADDNQRNPYVSPTLFCGGTTLAPAGFFSFAGGTSNKDSHTIAVTIDSITVTGYREAYYDWMLISYNNIHEAPASFTVSNSNFTENVGYGTSNQYQSVWLDRQTLDSSSYYYKNRAALAAPSF